MSTQLPTLPSGVSPSWAVGTAGGATPLLNVGRGWEIGKKGTRQPSPLHVGGMATNASTNARHKTYTPTNRPRCAFHLQLRVDQHDG
jgi:hypothetical protein